MNGQFNVYNIVDSSKSITMKIKGSFLESAVVMTGKIYAATNYGNFIIYDVEKNLFETKNPINFGVYGPLIVDKNHLFFGDERKNLNVIDEDFKNLQTLQIDTLFRSKPLIYDGRLFIGGLKKFVIVDHVGFFNFIFSTLFSRFK